MGGIADNSSTSRPKPGRPGASRGIGRALAAGDLDNDGRVDPGVMAQRTPLVFWHNQTPRGGSRRHVSAGRDQVQPRWRGQVVTVTVGGSAAAPGAMGAAAISRPPTRASISAWDTTASTKLRSAGLRARSITSKTSKSIVATGCGRETQTLPCCGAGAANVPRRVPSRTAPKFEQVRAAGNDSAAFELGKGGRREFKRNRQSRRESCHSRASNAELLAHDQYDRKLNRARRWVLLAGLLAGLSSFGIGEALYDLIPAKKVKATRFFAANTLDATPETISAADAEQRPRFGVLGECLGASAG